MISRVDPLDPDGIMLAIKGGNNGENHNQNDLGAFIIHLSGESLIADLGSGTYTRDYFGPGRYDILVNSSRGHDVPLINDSVQSTGREFRAKVVHHSSARAGDVLELELSGAYPPEAGLVSLRRRATLLREGSGSVRIEDHATFREDRNTARCPLYTWGDPVVEPGEVEVSGDKGSIRIRHSTDGTSVAVDELDLKDPKFEAPVKRIIFDLETSGKTLDLSMVFTPF
jgi:hypothetical protein